MTYLVACLFIAIGILFLLRGTYPGLVYGIITLGNGANLIIFSMGDVLEGAFPFVNRFDIYSDPLIQALVLTAIVISFATLCFVVALIKKLNELGTEL